MGLDEHEAMGSEHACAWALGMLTILMAGCTEGDRSERDDDGIELPGASDGEPEIGLDLPSHGPLAGDDSCATVHETVERVPQPADILVVLDDSGSMSFEAGEIQDRMNDFSSQIVASGIDVRVVLVSSYPSRGNGICIEPPLGGGGCPLADDAPPTFTHVDRLVGSHDAWAVLLDTHAEWAGVLREPAKKHVVVVTDDTSNLGWSSFDAQFQALDAGYVGYVHHSVVCHSACPSAAGIGTDYIALSDHTGGVAADLCDQDFQAVFDVLTTEVIGSAGLSCELAIPPPPDGMVLDPDAVELAFDDGMGGVLPIDRVGSPAGCSGVVDGWHYDDPAAPAMIMMCPQTCARFQTATSGAIDVAFGCATIPAG